MPESTVALMVRRQKEALLLHEADEMRLLARRWLEVEKALEAEMLKIALAMQNEGILTEAMILQDRRFQNLLYKARAEYAQFADDFAATAGQMQDYGLTKGVSDAVKVLNLSIDEAGLLIDFEVLNVEAINAMIGLTADGTPLRTLLMKEYGDSVNKMVNALTNGLARGLNPKTVAAEMADGFAAGLQKALTIARTEMLRAYRMGTQEQYRASEVVVQYKRLAVKDDRTCLGCLMQDGETFENAAANVNSAFGFVTPSRLADSAKDARRSSSSNFADISVSCLSASDPFSAFAASSRICFSNSLRVSRSDSKADFKPLVWLSNSPFTLSSCVSTHFSKVKGSPLP